VKDNDPGDYYRRKTDTAYALRESIQLIEKLKLLDIVYADKYEQTIKFLRNRLEFARYVGD
jgi:hypothetical protein